MFRHLRNLAKLYLQGNVCTDDKALTGIVEIERILNICEQNRENREKKERYLQLFENMVEKIDEMHAILKK
jgi:hypothetical protein